MPKLSAMLDGTRQQALRLRGVAKGELEEAERAQVERDRDRLHHLQTRFDGEARTLDVAAVRVDQRAHRGWAAEVLTDLLGELEALVGIARRELPVPAPAFELGEMHEDVRCGALVALLAGLCQRFLEPRARAGEVVDVLQPLTELPADA